MVRLLGHSAKLLVIVGAAVALSACAELPRYIPTQVETSAQPVAMTVGAPAIPPAGLMGFCLRYLSECRATTVHTTIVTLTAARRRQLETVQAKVNAEIAPRDVPGHAWYYTANGAGECNEYALEKRRDLIKLGWPRSALLLTAALTETGEGHLVLVARTSAGDLVLDNRLAPVVDWTYLPYHWLSQQSPRSLAEWMTVDAGSLHAGLTDRDQRKLL